MFDPPSTRRRNAQEDDEDEDDEEEEEEDDEDEDDDEEGDDPPSVPGEPELTRAERRELKKKQAAEKDAKGATEVGDGDEDDLIANPNRITKKLNISDLSAPREMTRRERYVPVSPCTSALSFFLPYLSSLCLPFFFVNV
jgi:hypothetical protein